MDLHKLIGSLSNLFMPKEADAEVIPQDSFTQKTMQNLMAMGGLPASTLRVAMLLPDTTNMNVGGRQWGVAKRFLPDVQLNNTLGVMATDSRSRNKEGYPIYEGSLSPYYLNQSFRPEDVLSPERVMAHELVHFIVNATDFFPRLEAKNVNEEKFADFLGGAKVDPAKEKLYRSLASEMFLATMKRNQ